MFFIIFLTHPAFADDEESVSSGSLTDDVFAFFVVGLSLKWKEKKG